MTVGSTRSTKVVHCNVKDCRHHIQGLCWAYELLLTKPDGSKPGILRCMRYEKRKQKSNN